jgi:hypothetical protein
MCVTRVEGVKPTKLVVYRTGSRMVERANESITMQELEAGLVQVVEEVVEYRVRTRRGQPHPAPAGDLAWLSAAVDDGLAKADEAEPDEDEAA